MFVCWVPVVMETAPDRGSREVPGVHRHPMPAPPVAEGDRGDCGVDLPEVRHEGARCKALHGNGADGIVNDPGSERTRDESKVRWDEGPITIAGCHPKARYPGSSQRDWLGRAVDALGVVDRVALLVPLDARQPRSLEGLPRAHRS